MKKILIFALVLFIYGCGDSNVNSLPTVKSEVSVGGVVSANYIQETFSTWGKTEIETDNAIFVLSGIVPVVKGDSATLRTMSNNTMYICFESFNLCHHVWGS